MWVLIFSTTFVWNISHSKKKRARYDKKCILVFMYSGADKSLARPTSRCILFDGENISFDASLIIYINSTNIPPNNIINGIYYSYCCLCILIVRPRILSVIYVFLLLSMYSYCSSMYSFVIYVYLLLSTYS
jgi:hypothetical protein